MSYLESICNQLYGNDGIPPEPSDNTCENPDYEILVDFQNLMPKLVHKYSEISGGELILPSGRLIVVMHRKPYDCETMQEVHDDLRQQIAANELKYVTEEIL